jgi:hypothetical protein
LLPDQRFNALALLRFERPSLLFVCPLLTQYLIQLLLGSNAKSFCVKIYT